MVKFSLSAVRFVCRQCSVDLVVFGQQLPMRRKIAPFHKFESGRIAWGYR